MQLPSILNCKWKVWFIGFDLHCAPDQAGHEAYIKAAGINHSIGINGWVWLNKVLNHKKIREFSTPYENFISMFFDLFVNKPMKKPIRKASTAFSIIIIWGTVGISIFGIPKLLFILIPPYYFT